jgi:hypothetical protein
MPLVLSSPAHRLTHLLTRALQAVCGGVLVSLTFVLVLPWPWRLLPLLALVFLCGMGWGLLLADRLRRRAAHD